MASPSRRQHVSTPRSRSLRRQAKLEVPTTPPPAAAPAESGSRSRTGRKAKAKPSLNRLPSVPPFPIEKLKINEEAPNKKTPRHTTKANVEKFFSKTTYEAKDDASKTTSAPVSEEPQAIVLDAVLTDMAILANAGGNEQDTLKGLALDLLESRERKMTFTSEEKKTIIEKATLTLHSGDVPRCLVKELISSTQVCDNVVGDEEQKIESVRHFTRQYLKCLKDAETLLAQQAPAQDVD